MNEYLNNAVHLFWRRAHPAYIARSFRRDAVGTATPDSAMTILKSLRFLTAFICVASSFAVGQTTKQVEDFPPFESLVPDLPSQETPGVERVRPSSQIRTFETPVPADERNRLLPFDDVAGNRRLPTEPQDESTKQRRLFGAGDAPVVNRDVPSATDSTPSVYRFDWTQHSSSIADLHFSSASEFQHGVEYLSTAEELAYLDLIDAIADQRRQLLQQTAETSAEAGRRVSRAGVAAWEQAFYQYADARRLAWENGHLRNREIPADMPGGLPDPFRRRDADSDSLFADSDARFQLLDDIARFPEDYVGRPIVLFGRFKAESIVRIAPGQHSNATIENGFSDSPARSEVRLLRGALTSFDGLQPKALVDTGGLLTPSERLAYDQWPSTDAAVPVMVKGWVVKKMDGRPLVYCETMRQLSPIPHFDLVRQNSVDKQRLRDEETWLYYETLRQLEITSQSQQQDIADGVLSQRIGDLMQAVNNKTDRGLSELGSRLKSGSIDDATYRRQKVALERQLNHRVARYRQYREDPESFQTYVDMFQYPDVWHGHLVTFEGHVRHMVSYAGDEKLFNGRPLHELWLFTDDSQHNPAVIVTPHLPDGFPLQAEVLDRVKVTGCFFKRYVYGSQDTTRIAPLILAGTVSWEPTVDQVQALVAAGHLSEGSAQALRAAAHSGTGLGDTAMIFVSVFVVLTLMILWGRNQREERDRIRLRKRVSGVPEFENPPTAGYSLPLSDFNVDLPGETAS
jgi:hypothetical protein